MDINDTLLLIKAALGDRLGGILMMQKQKSLNYQIVKAYIWRRA